MIVHVYSAGKSISLGLGHPADTKGEVSAPPIPERMPDSVLVGRNVTTDVQSWWKEQSGKWMEPD